MLAMLSVARLSTLMLIRVVITQAGVGETYDGSASSYSTIPRDIPTTTTHVYLSQNAITEILDSDFDDLNDLLALDLSKNRITNIAVEAFRSNAQLNKLELNDNHIGKLPDDFLLHNSRVKILNLTGNHLTGAPMSVSTLSLMITLELGHNQIVQIPMNFFRNMSVLKFLDLSYNNLTRFDSDTPLPNLEHLYMASNNIQVMANISRLAPNLEFLWYSNNEVDFRSSYGPLVPPEVAPHFEGNVRLVKLNLEKNELWEMPSLPNSPELEWLKLAVNNIQEIPSNYFHNLAGLRKITLNRNNLTRFDSNTTFYQLEKLYLGHNRIRVMPNVSRFAPNLFKLDLAANEIGTVPDGCLNGLERLQYLMLDHNNLHSFPSAPNFIHLKSLRSLTIHGNPLACDTDLCWLKTMEVQTSWASKLSGWPCPRLGKNWKQVSSAELGCNEATYKAKLLEVGERCPLQSWDDVTLPRADLSGYQCFDLSVGPLRACDVLLQVFGVDGGFWLNIHGQGLACNQINVGLDAAVAPPCSDCPQLLRCHHMDGWKDAFELDVCSFRCACLGCQALVIQTAEPMAGAVCQVSTVPFT